jgi:hypothetical protein
VLLLWPTWWGLWFAAGGLPSLKNLVIFTLGVIVMRCSRLRDQRLLPIASSTRMSAAPATDRSPPARSALGRR